MTYLDQLKQRRNELVKENKRMDDLIKEKKKSLRIVKFRLTINRLFHFLARLILGTIIICLPILMFNSMYVSPIILIVIFLLVFVCIYILS